MSIRSDDQYMRCNKFGQVKLGMEEENLHVSHLTEESSSCELHNEFESNGYVNLN